MKALAVEMEGSGWVSKTPEAKANGIQGLSGSGWRRAHGKGPAQVGTQRVRWLWLALWRCGH